MRLIVIITNLLFVFFAKAQYQTQLDLSKNFADGNYTVYRNDQGKVDKIAKLWPITIERSGDLINKVIVKRAGVVEEEYTPDLKESPGYFVYEDYRLIFTPSLILCYKQKGSGYEVSDFDIAFQFINGGGSTLKIDDAKTYLANYRKAALNNQSNARETIAKNKEAAELAEREANSLKGKNVKSIVVKAVDIPTKIGHFQKIEFGVVATLHDGKELKTKNLGGKTDFEFSYDISAPGCTFANGVLEVGDDASLFPNDEIVVTIKNIHNTAQSIQHKITLTYSMPINISYIGSSGSSGNSGSSGAGNSCDGKPGTAGKNGEDAKDYTIKLIETKHKKTGVKLYAAEITKSGDGKVYKIKIDPTAQININSIGGKGGAGGSGGSINSYNSCKNGLSRGGFGGNGGNGGRGGNVSIAKSSNEVPNSIIVINNKGGEAGAGGRGGSGAASGNNGLQGAEGKVSINVSPFKLSW